MDMISASAADAHRFGRVKRNGYDPVEVDAVVARLVDALRGYETKTERLEERLAEADASADAIRRTFIAAENTRDEILGAARQQAESIRHAATAEANDVLETARTQAAEVTDSAHEEAEGITALARDLDHKISQQRIAGLAAAHEEAEQIRADAEADAAARTTEAMEYVEGIVNTAVGESEHREREAAEAARATATATAWMRREAMSEAAEIVERAEERAALIIADAERDGVMIHQRVAKLRAAIATVEASARNLADVTSTEVSVIDLSQIEAIEATTDVDEEALERKGSDDDTDAPSMMAEVPAMVSVGEADAAVDAVDDDAPAEEPKRLLTVAEATAALDLEDVDDEPEPEPAEPPSAPTYYQRSTGVPLSERVKIARKSG